MHSTADEYLDQALEAVNYADKYNYFARVERMVQPNSVKLRELIDQCAASKNEVASEIVVEGCGLLITAVDGLEFSINAALKTGLANRIREFIFPHLSVAAQLEFIARTRVLPDFELVPTPRKCMFGAVERYEIDTILHLMCRLPAAQTQQTMKKFNNWLQRVDSAWVPKSQFVLAMR